MKTKALLTVLLFVVMGAVVSLQAQQTENIGFYQQISGGNYESSQNGNMVESVPGRWPYFSSSAVVEFAIEVTGNIYPIPEVSLTLNSYDKLRYTATEYGKTIYGTLNLQGYSYNYYHFTVNLQSTSGTGSVNARVRIVRIVSGNPYARIGYPTEMRLSCSK